MVVLGGRVVSYERGTPVHVPRQAYRGTSIIRNSPPPPSATVGPYACSYCRDLEGAVSYNRGTPVPHAVSQAGLAAQRLVLDQVAPIHHEANLSAPKRAYKYLPPGGPTSICPEEGHYQTVSHQAIPTPILTCPEVDLPTTL